MRGVLLLCALPGLFQRPRLALRAVLPDGRPREAFAEELSDKISSEASEKRRDTNSK